MSTQVNKSGTFWAEVFDGATLAILRNIAAIVAGVCIGAKLVIWVGGVL